MKSSKRFLVLCVIPSRLLRSRVFSDLENWRFLDDWSDCLPWRSERHITATLYCDASKQAWEGVLMTDNGRVEAGDYWREDSGSINFLEARTLLCALDAFKSRIRNSRVDIHTDSRALLGSWQSGSGSNTEINDVIKAILRCSQEFNFSIDMQYVSSTLASSFRPRLYPFGGGVVPCPEIVWAAYI